MVRLLSVLLVLVLVGSISVMQCETASHNRKFSWFSRKSKWSPSSVLSMKKSKPGMGDSAENRKSSLAKPTEFGTVGEGKEITLSFSGGGVRAMVTGVIAFHHLKQKFKIVEIYGISGGSWAAYLVANYDTDCILNKMFNQRDLGKMDDFTGLCDEMGCHKMWTDSLVKDLEPITTCKRRKKPIKYKVRFDLCSGKGEDTDSFSACQVEMPLSTDDKPDKLVCRSKTGRHLVSEEHLSKFYLHGPNKSLLCLSSWNVDKDIGTFDVLSMSSSAYAVAGTVNRLVALAVKLGKCEMQSPAIVKRTSSGKLTPNRFCDSGGFCNLPVDLTGKSERKTVLIDATYIDVKKGESLDKPLRKGCKDYWKQYGMDCSFSTRQGHMRAMTCGKMNIVMYSPSDGGGSLTRFLKSTSLKKVKNGFVNYFKGYSVRRFMGYLDKYFVSKFGTKAPTYIRGAIVCYRHRGKLFMKGVGGNCKRTTWGTCGRDGQCKSDSSDPCSGTCVCGKKRLNQCFCVKEMKVDEGHTEKDMCSGYKNL